MSDEFQASSRTATPVKIAEVREQLEQVLALAAGISDATKNVIALLAEGNTSEEIAAQLGITVSGVYGVVKRFRSAARAECLAANTVPSLHAMRVGGRPFPAGGSRDRATRPRPNAMGQPGQLHPRMRIVSRRAAGNDAAR